MLIPTLALPFRITFKLKLLELWGTVYNTLTTASYEEFPQIFDP